MITCHCVENISCGGQDWKQGDLLGGYGRGPGNNDGGGGVMWRGSSRFQVGFRRRVDRTH